MITLVETSVDSTVSAEAVWRVVSDVAGRPRWHPGLEWARLDGPLVAGAQGAWKPRGARPVSVRVTEVEPGRRLVMEGTHGPAVARGHYEHLVAPRPGGGSTLTQRVSLSGPLAAPIAAAFGGPLGVSATAEAVRALVAEAADVQGAATITHIEERRPARPRLFGLAARRLSAPLRGLDPAANAVTDAMNAAVPWLWWPLHAPHPGRPLPPAAHALYLAHAAMLHFAARALGSRMPTAASAVLAFAGWALFTGAWDRRAAEAPARTRDQASSAASSSGSVTGRWQAKRSHT